MIGPTGPAGFVWYRGETALARAAAAANIPFTVASTSNTAMEKIIANGGGTQWYQLYVWQDAEAALVTVKRALDAGFEALVVTVDSPVYNNREIDIRNGLVFPPRVTLRSAIDGVLHPRWLIGTVGRYILDEGRLPAFTNIHIPDEHKSNAKSYVSAASKSFLNRNDSLDWDFLRRLRDLWPRKLLVKGILHPDDAVLAADCGADGIFVSNHAGNVNDTAITAWDALPAIVDAVGNRLTIIADTGVRRGSDVLKGLALRRNCELLRSNGEARTEESEIRPRSHSLHGRMRGFRPMLAPVVAFIRPPGHSNRCNVRLALDRRRGGGFFWIGFRGWGGGRRHLYPLGICR